jgi:hypothetical protein
MPKMSYHWKRNNDFFDLAQSGRFTVSELSEEFEITRKTGHKW